MAISATPASAGFADIDQSDDPDFYIGYLRQAQADEQVQRMKQESLALLALEPGLDLLEVGCGLGDEVAAAQALLAPGRAVGIDGSRRMIEQAKLLHPTLELAVGDAQKLELASASFDRYRAERVYQHLDDPRKALADWITSPENPYFAKATANWVWSQFFGKGIADPTAMIALIMSGAFVFNYAVANEGVPQLIHRTFVAWDLSPTKFLLCVDVLMLLLAIVLDEVTILLVIVPLGRTLCSRQCFCSEAGNMWRSPSQTWIRP